MRNCSQHFSVLSLILTRAATHFHHMAQFPEEQTESGAFKRQDDAFRDWVKRDGSAPYSPERGRYHLYVSFACPWAHRTIILRKLKGLEDAIGMTVVDPVRDERG